MRILFLVFLSLSLYATGMPKEYYEIKNTKEMKKYFFDYMDNLATKENQKILEDREFIKRVHSVSDQLTKEKSPISYEKFHAITKRYKLEGKSLEVYLEEIDIIPNSLVLAQASVESGWGKSRFFKEANNIFGQWTWSGKGLDPINRDEGKTHKIKIFDSLQDAVRGYMVNLNNSWGYKELRKQRALMRKDGKPIDSIVLAKTLINYSQKKEIYTKLLADIIINNNLQKYDK
jgi:Bax protein